MNDSSRSVRFYYLYRDAGNWKNYGYVTFTNPKEMTLTEVEEKLQDKFIWDTNFIASEWHIPDLFFEEYDPEEDVEWHEFTALEYTEKEPNDSLGRTIDQFLEQVKKSPHYF